ncbi:Bug family tripartite tricarboxylate transporter substrate binding protein [Hydrogenophaga sp.]|jgi:tripartite-type tricarboxylate transporter receptor subunit TctC|uniref:Bug family tripartite tricarboxylate transporter substrate binding protein n=1 Tax=Hydrogenophaga sp. TaxID=1904254 RepID=UPI003F723391
MRQKLLRVATGLAMFLSASLHAQTWPQKPITIVIGFPAGGDTDVVARIYADKLSSRLGQPVIVENKPGASGMIGAAYVAKAPADGYTIMNVASTFAIAPHVVAPSPGIVQDPVNDFTAIFQVSKAPLVAFTGVSTNIKSLSDLVRDGKAGKPLSYGTPGSGTPMHLLGEQFKNSAGIPMMHVPYKGSAPVLTDALAGHISVGWTSPASVSPHLTSGKLLALAVSSPERSALLPNVPTFTESGFPDVRFVSWQGFLGPKNLPPEVVQTLNKHLNEITQMPDVRARLASIGLEPVGGAPDHFANTVRGDYERLGAMVRKYNIKLD